MDFSENSYKYILKRRHSERFLYRNSVILKTFYLVGISTQMLSGITPRVQKLSSKDSSIFFRNLFSGSLTNFSRNFLCFCRIPFGNVHESERFQGLYKKFSKNYSCDISRSSTKGFFRKSSSDAMAQKFIERFPLGF